MLIFYMQELFQYNGAFDHVSLTCSPEAQASSKPTLSGFPSLLSLVKVALTNPQSLLPTINSSVLCTFHVEKQKYSCTVA